MNFTGQPNSYSNQPLVGNGSSFNARSDEFKVQPRPAPRPRRPNPFDQGFGRIQQNTNAAEDLFGDIAIQPQPNARYNPYQTSTIAPSRSTSNQLFDFS